MAERLAFLVPHPPSALRPNRRAAHWATRYKAADEYSEAVFVAWMERGDGPATWFKWAARTNGPYKAARVVYTWRHAGVAPDIDNIAGAIKVLQDCLCVAPAKASEDRYYLGLIENDQGIEATFRRQKVSRRADEGVFVEIERVQ